jgi:hypothetical protein
MDGKLVHELSCPSHKSELDLWAIPPTNVAIRRKYEVEYRPISVISGDPSVIQFVIPGSVENYIDLDETELYVKLKISVKDKETVLKPSQWPGKVSVVNNLLHSLFQKIELKTSNAPLTVPNNYYAYRAYLEKLLGESTLSASTHLYTEGYTNDDFIVISGDTNSGRRVALNTERIKQFKEDGSDGLIELMGRLHLDLSQQEKLIIGGLDLMFSLFPHKPTFYLHCAADTYNINVSFEEVLLYVKHANVYPPILAVHEKALRTSPAKYPIARREIKTWCLAKGVQNAPLNNVFSGTLPRRIFLCMTSNTAENGSYTTNPFFFDHFDLEYARCSRGDEEFPAIAYRPEFDKKSWVREYRALFRGINQLNCRPCCPITYNKYGDGYTILVFNLAPDYADGCSGHFSLVKNGSINIDLHFKKALPTAVTVLLFAEYDNIIEIDHDRNIKTEF